MKIALFISALTLFSSMEASPALSVLPKEGKISVQNRVLARLNDKTFTVIDVMEKMNLFLSKNYPQHADSPIARVQFYVTHWKDFLSQMLDQELILLDAKDLDLFKKITEKEVRERLHERFGPNLMVSFNKLNITYEKAKEHILNELAIEKITLYRVHSKVHNNIGPNEIKNGYKEYLKKNPPYTEWEYQVISFRGVHSDEVKKLSDRAYSLLLEGKVEPEDLKETLLPNSHELSLDQTAIAVSGVNRGTSISLSKQHQEALSSLAPLTYSKPLCQTSRSSQGDVYRIFYLISQAEKKPLSFHEMDEKIANELYNKILDDEMAHYISRLRVRYHYDKIASSEEIPESFQPFNLY